MESTPQKRQNLDLLTSPTRAVASSPIWTVASTTSPTRTVASSPTWTVASASSNSAEIPLSVTIDVEFAARMTAAVVAISIRAVQLGAAITIDFSLVLTLQCPMDRTLAHETPTARSSASTVEMHAVLTSRDTATHLPTSLGTVILALPFAMGRHSQLP